MGEDDDQITRRRFLATTAVATAGLAVGCGGGEGADAGGDGDAGALDAASTDGGSGDGGPEDGGPEDGGPEDGGPEDAGGPDPAEPPEGFTESPTDFPFGVASGDVTSSAAIFWTSYAGVESVDLVVWEMDGDTYARTVHAAGVTPVDGYVHQDVSALEPAKRYRYAFFVVEAGARTLRSAIGRMRAAFGVDTVETLFIGAVSCTSNGRSLETLAHAAARDDLDVFLYTGDTTYNDGATSLAEYRAKWEEQMGQPEYQAIRASTSALATWDDHEFTNNYNPETLDTAQREAAIQSFFEYQPIRRDPASRDRVWKLMQWGRTADIFVLDCRNERMPPMRGREDIYLSREQMDWLKAGLESSTAVFKIIVNSVPITDFPGLFDFAQNDRWEGYSGQRTEILSHIEDLDIKGVLWLSGDFHLASAGRVGRSGDLGDTQIELLVGPGAQSSNPLARTLGGDQFDFGSGTNNYTVLELLPAMTRVRAWWVDGEGSSFEVWEYDLG